MPQGRAAVARPELLAARHVNCVRTLRRVVPSRNPSKRFAPLLRTVVAIASPNGTSVQGTRQSGTAGP
nr:hypothetical protein BOSE7B_40959 [Bosea sp. 7B]